VKATRSPRRVQAWIERGHAALDHGRERWPLFDLGVTVVTRPDYVNDTLLSSYFAMRLFVLLFPLAYTVVAGIGVYAGSSADRAGDATKNVGITGALASSVADAARGSQRAHVAILVAGLVLTVWAARSGLRALRLLSAVVWRVPVPKTPLAEWGGLAFALGVVFVAGLGIEVNRLHDHGWSLVTAEIGLGLVAGGLWWIVAQRLPNGGRRAVDHLPGAVLVAVAAPAIHAAVQLYFAPKLARATTTYGVLGASLVLLTYLLVVGWMLVLACELSAALLGWRERRGSTVEMGR
jgi:uncharacterized BrkB/YihY/UPF0761 family membrane protein